MYECIKWKEFNPKPMKFIAKNKTCTKMLATDFICMDTETSHMREIGWIYHWAFDYQGQIIFGRKPSQLVECLNKIIDVNHLGYNTENGDERKLVVYIHNLSYDYEYIKDWLYQAFGREDCSMLATGKHKLISWNIKGIEFRCSFRLTLKSLATWSKEMNVSQKKTGKVDHSIIRYQDTEMSDDDIEYLKYDIISLRESLEKQMYLYGHTIKNIPYTVTGYVREAARKEFRKDRNANERQFKKEALSLEVYQMCKDENAGGISHGNRFMADITQKGCIRHRDFVSHYPSQQKCFKAPKGHFRLEYQFSKNDSKRYKIEELLKLGEKRCFLARVCIRNLELRKDITMPYAQKCKFYDGRIDKPKFYEDNGRILRYEGSCIVTVNEIDLKILVKQYKFGYVIDKVYSFEKAPYPKYLQDTVDKYFYDKTLYKDLEREIEKTHGKMSSEWVTNRAKLTISKGMLNGIFGMTDTDPVHVSYDEIEGGEWTASKFTEEDIEEELSEYYDGYNSFMSYQLGVWTTANARYQLIELIELIGYENFIYCDTDSIFYYSTPEIEERIEEYNCINREIGEKNKWYAEVNGRKVYYNQFDLEDEDIVSFRFLHAKCYAYEVRKMKEGKEVIELETVIAGVKRFGRNDNNRVNELGSINELHDGKVFKDCGGTQVNYNFHEPTTAFINGHETEFASAAIIFDVEKTLHSMFYHAEHYIEYEKSFDYE